MSIYADDYWARDLQACRCQKPTCAWVVGAASRMILPDPVLEQLRRRKTGAGRGLRQLAYKEPSVAKAVDPMLAVAATGFLRDGNCQCSLQSRPLGAQIPQRWKLGVATQSASSVFSELGSSEFLSFQMNTYSVIACVACKGWH